jgi:small subunit ribosomal protein S19
MSRSLKKGPFVSNCLLKKISNLNNQNHKTIISTWSRSSVILPIMIGHTIAVYNGRVHIPLLISDQMVGHKLGEFVQTRSYVGHIKTDKKTKR